jgi:hypothetical protein
LGRLVAAALVAAAAAGCGGSTAGDAVVSLDGAPVGAETREPGRVVLRFVQAARAGNARTMWNLLSAPTRASIGPTFERFARATALDLAEDFEDYREFSIHLSRSLGRRWGVGAVTARYAPEGEEPEPAAFAAAVRRERGTWRLELAGLVVEKLDPDPLDETGPRPVLGAEAQAGADVARMVLWLDGRAVGARGRSLAPFTAELRGVPDRDLAEGLHTAVVFAATRDTAGAVAWPFEVD